MMSTQIDKSKPDTRLLSRIAAGCAAYRSELIGNSFSEEEAKEALKSARWLVDELIKRVRK